MRFSTRSEAGKKLSQKLEKYRNHENALVLGLPRGGVPVAYEIAKALNLPLDAFIVRKLGVPGQEELAMGAIATGGIQVLNDEVIQAAGVSPEDIERTAARERVELRRREELYRPEDRELDPAGKTVLLADDGIATGASMWSAVEALRKMEAERIVVAVPVSPRSTKEEFEDRVDEFVCVSTPEPFMGVGAWYEDFSQTTDEEVRQLLQEAEQDGTAKMRRGSV